MKNYFYSLPEELQEKIYKILWLDVLVEIKNFKYLSESYFKQKYDKTMSGQLYDMYKAITDLNLWMDIYNDKSDHLVFSKEKWLKTLLSHKDVDKYGHSGGSFSWCIAVMIKEMPDEIVI